MKSIRLRPGRERLAVEKARDDERGAPLDELGVG